MGVTAIDKRPVVGPVRVKALGAYGDVQTDREHHGGRDKALYAYAQEAADRWAAELAREVPPGLFGENLRTSGVDVDGAEIGERWRIGTGEDALEVEVTMPRTPCATFARRLGEERWVKRFTRSGVPGAYLRVVRPGTISAGDAVEVLLRPGHGVGVGRWLADADPADARTLLACAADGGLDLAPDLREALLPASRR
ncbi:MOSC domain-containing protein YiiM [Quadrisphaera granulorum]|uniref:MOSC domain-containing protein YiiM n=1 Tax=Quadrisphaera granulorum TaxID=317664 RepID=A0A316A7X8_9ACTN|nr:MOSC domain-containing protein YiiM [Quadrisphaera granulorum]SZE96483.1 MOSC domain-containing protein YiiM [Quadrisphaera granulorum]